MMQSKSNLHVSNLDWDAFLAHLTDYVRLELNGGAADKVYPDIAFAIATSEPYEMAYYQEFRKQGLRKDISELRKLGNRDAVAEVMQSILGGEQVKKKEVSNPNWYEVALEQGRGWLERGTKRWRRLQLSLPSLKQGHQPAPALSGMMGTESGGAVTPGNVIHVNPENADFEVTLTLRPTPKKDGDLYRLDVIVTLLEQFGDFSGVEVTLSDGETARQQLTDSLGKVSFDGLPIDRLTEMSVTLTLPQ